jgi:hypothetical protein
VEENGKHRILISVIMQYIYPRMLLSVANECWCFTSQIPIQGSSVKCQDHLILRKDKLVSHVLTEEATAT